MMNLSKALTLTILCWLVMACSEGVVVETDDESNATVEVTDSTTLARAAGFENGTRVDGTSPVPPIASAPQMAGPAEIPMTRNSFTDFTYEVPLPNVNSKIGAVFIQIEGSDEHFIMIPDDNSAPRALSGDDARYTAHSDLANITSSSHALRSVPCLETPQPCGGFQLTALPLNASAVSLTVNTPASISSAIIDDATPILSSTYDWSQVPAHRWTQPLPVNITATPTGSGDLQFTLIWNSTADMDLHIFEPDGAEIAWNSRASVHGLLDVDDTNGYGPENVFYHESHDAGNYRVEVQHFSGALPTNYTLTITNKGTTTTYTGSVTSNREKDIVTTITSTGSDNNNVAQGDFCYDHYPQDPCDLLETESGASASTFTTANSCSTLGFSGATQTYDFGTTYGSFGQSTDLGIVGTCVVTY